MEILTLAALRDREHELHAYCHCCERWRVLDLDQMLAQWRGRPSPPAEVQCAECGEFGMLKVRRRLSRHEAYAVRAASFAG